MKRILLVLLVVAALPAGAQEFVDGTHLVNGEAVAAHVEYVHSTMTTAICDVREPTEEIRNGIGGALDREVEGFTVLAREDLEYGNGVRVTARVEPGTTVHCLCVDGCDVRVLGVADVEVGMGGTVEVGGGAVAVRREARAVVAPLALARADLRATIEYGIGLLEAGETGEFVLALAAPAQLAEILGRTPYSELVGSLAGDRGQGILAALKHTRALEPEVLDEGAVVWFRIEDPEIYTPRKRLEFYRVEGRWYLGN